MMHINCSWLPNETEIDLNDFNNQVELAYKQFEKDFIKSHPCFNNKPVYIRKYPQDSERYYSFNHIITKDYDRINGNSSAYNDRKPDIRRLERIYWVRLLIEHPKCIPLNTCNCKGTFCWYVPYKNTYRVNILLYDELYLVVLEKHRNKEFYLLVTAYYLDNEVARDKQYKKYKDDKKNPYIPSKL